MTQQPSTPATPPPPALSASDRAEIVQGVRDGNALAQQIQREAAQAVREGQAAAGAARAGAASVVKEASGRVVVTGADGRTVIIDPKAGLSQDAVQEMVQTALAPAPHFSPPQGPTGGEVAMVSIIFPCLLVMVWMITRAFSGRRAGGVATLAPDAAARLARIEQAVEAVAIEVERISEAQRYSARLLTERLPDAARAGDGLPTVGAPVLREGV